ncbi:MAG: hypothetical protein HY053_00165 [Proteobacteria bacterium]|nr:hypothetical protein [Pseudomonadota bacterium]
MFTFSYAAREKGRCFPFLSAFNISDIPASKTCVTWLETAKDDLMQSLGRSSAQLPERLSEKLFCGVKMWCKMSVASRRLFWGP